MPSTRSGQIARRRFEAQRIASTTFTRAEEVVGWLGAVQAQDYLGALWAIGLRLPHATEAAIEDALATRRIVRTWPMRGTLHFVAAADALWMTELLAPRPVAAAASRLRARGIDQAVLSRARRVLVRHLEGGRRLTRLAAYRALEKVGIAASDERALHVLWRLAQDCFVCFGPRDCKQQTFVLFEEWLPHARTLSREEALAELACRYFGSHGPATVPDFAWWSGLTFADARRAIALAEGRIREEPIDDQRYWSTDGPHAVPSRPAPRLLPAFDELLVGYSDRSASLDASVSGRVASGGMLHPVVVREGRVVGTWKRQVRRREVVCSVAPFTRLDEATGRSLTRALHRYARFLGLDLRTGAKP